MTHSTLECAREGRVLANENNPVDTASNELGMSTPIVTGQQTSLNSASFFFFYGSAVTSGIVSVI